MAPQQEVMRDRQARAPQPTVFALLAAQVAAVRDRIESDAATHVELLSKAADTVTQLVTLLDRLARHAGRLPAELAASCALAEAADMALGRALDEGGFKQAQNMDLSRQMADGVVRALHKLDAGGGMLSPEQIAAFFVSAEQHAVHALAVTLGDGTCAA
jgi:hypothetical protein